MRIARNAGRVALIFLLTTGGLCTPLKYVGSKTCAGCHPQIYSSYSKTDMGRSMSSSLQAVQEPITFRNAKLNRSFEVRSKKDGLYQSEYQVGDNGVEIFRNEQKLAYAVGAGRNGTSYLVERNGFLFQAPLSYYTLAKTWGMSPGFEALDIAFNRPVLAGCMNCHSGSALPISPGSGEYARPPFKELAIGCESCHGPGEAHVAERKARRPLKAAVDRSIVNPAKLSPWLADNICMACHQGRALRVLQPGREFGDFRPGTPLDSTMAIFVAPLPDKDSSASLPPLLEHYSLMSVSKCYTGTRGRLSCLTCHDPHVQSESESVNYFRKKCLTCHQEASCKLPIETRKEQSAADDCAGCHMPKAPVNGIAHSVLTNHRIVRTESEEFPTSLFNSSRPIVSGLIHLNAEPGKPHRVPNLTVFRAFTELATGNPAYTPNYVAMLRLVANENPEEPDVLSALGWLKMGTGPEHDPAEAMKYLERAIDRGSHRPEDYQALAGLLVKEGRIPDAIRILEKGIQLAPYDERLYKSLSLTYMSVHQYQSALDTMRRTVELFPEDSFMRSLLQKAEQTGAAP
jgi:hypothetical protein